MSFLHLKERAEGGAIQYLPEITFKTYLMAAPARCLSCIGRVDPGLS